MQSPDAIVRRLSRRASIRGRLDVADELISADVVEHRNFGPNHAAGPEGAKAVIASLRRAVSDFHLAIDDLAVDGDTVWLRMSGTGTDDGSFMRHAPTGRSMRTDVLDVLRVDDGRIVEHWGVPDRLGTLFQIGLAQPATRRGAHVGPAFVAPGRWSAAFVHAFAGDSRAVQVHVRPRPA